MHVLHVNAGYPPFIGGAETYLQVLSERLVRDGHRVTVVTTDATGVENFWLPGRPRLQPGQEHINGVTVHRCRVATLWPAPWAFFLLRRIAVGLGQLQHRKVNVAPLLRRLAPFMPWVPDLERTLAALPPAFDLVHGVNIALEWPLIVAWRYARRHGLPFVATPFVHVGEAGHREVSRYYTMPHQMEPLRDADAVIVQTGIEAEALAALGVPSERLHVVGMGVDPQAVQGGDADRFRAQHGLTGPIVAFLGTVTRDKGTFHLVEAVRHLWAQDHPVELVLAGPILSDFRAFFRRQPEAVRRRVHLPGPVQGRDKRDLLAAADVLAMPSRIDAFGIAYLEAWACRKPVIGAKAGGVPEVIDDGVDGLLVPFGDVHALSDALRTLLDHPDLARQMGEAGYRKVSARYTWERIYHHILALYRQLCPNASSS